LTGDLKHDLARALRGRACFVGVGSDERDDDAFGPALARRVSALGACDVIIAGTAPERWIGALTDGGFDAVVFLDAIQCDAAPGSVLFLNADEIETRFPQVSTHRIALGTLARLVAREGTRVYLLGVRPLSIEEGSGLSAQVRRTIDALAGLIMQTLDRKHQTEAMMECAP
jgi:hydrogenase maturation protease